MDKISLQGYLDLVNYMSKTAKINVCLIGAPFDTNNRGVSALASSLARLITDAVPAAKISFFMGNPARINKVVNFAGKDILVDIINYRMSPMAKLQEHILFLLFLAIIIRLVPSTRFRQMILRGNSRLSDLDDCNFVGAINGGDSFSDIYGLGRFVEVILPIIITILLGKRLILLPQTYGPYQSRLARVIARWIILRASAVLSRDRDSILLINDLLEDNASKVPIEFCPDVAFTLPSAFPVTFSVYPQADVFRKETWVGINVNGLMFHGGYTGANMFGLRFEYNAFILSLIEKLMKEISTKILLIPHTYGEKGDVESDPEASRQVYDALKDKYSDRLYLLTGEYREFEIKGIIGCCDFFIGSRMHACIAAISQGVATAAVAYSKKFRGVFEGVGLETMVVDARSLEMDEAVHRIIDLYRNHELAKASIEQKTTSAKKHVQKTVIRLLNSPCAGSEAR